MAGPTRIGPPSALPAIEKAVRPFIERRPEWRTGEPAPAQDEQEPVLEWSARTAIQVISLSGLSFEVQESAEDNEEVVRQVRDVRVENPDDPDQFVEVEVIDEIVFRDPVTGRQRRFRLNN